MRESSMKNARDIIVELMGKFSLDPKQAGVIEDALKSYAVEVRKESLVEAADMARSYTRVLFFTKEDVLKLRGKYMDDVVKTREFHGKEIAEAILALAEKKA